MPSNKLPVTAAIFILCAVLQPALGQTYGPEPDQGQSAGAGAQASGPATAGPGPQSNDPAAAGPAPAEQPVALPPSPEPVLLPPIQPGPPAGGRPDSPVYGPLPSEEFNQTQAPSPAPLPSLRPDIPIAVPPTQTAPIRTGQPEAAGGDQRLQSNAIPHHKPGEVDDQKAPWAVLDKARGAIRAGHAQAALPEIQQFILQCPLEPEGYFWQGVALDNMNQLDGAIAAYEKAIIQVSKAGMDSAELRINTGNVLLKKKLYEPAIIQFRRALEIDPRAALAELNLGRTLLETGKAGEALERFQRCDELKFQPAQLDYYRAKALVKLGRREDAKAQIKMALAKIPSGNEIATRIASEFADLLK